MKVEGNNAETALHLLKELKKQPIVDEENNVIKCPSCASHQIEGDIKRIKSIADVFAIIFSFLFWVYPLSFKTVHRCIVCDLEF